MRPSSGWRLADHADRRRALALMPRRLPLSLLQLLDSPRRRAEVVVGARGTTSAWIQWHACCNIALILAPVLSMYMRGTQDSHMQVLWTYSTWRSDVFSANAWHSSVQLASVMPLLLRLYTWTWSDARDHDMLQRKLETSNRPLKLHPHATGSECASKAGAWEGRRT